MNDLQIFENPKFGKIRGIDRNGEPWFVGKDVAEALGYAKPRNAISAYVEQDDALKQGVTDDMGRVQETIIINESGLYSLIFSSKLPQAREFKHWVTSEVLPTIRKTGSYALATISPQENPIHFGGIASYLKVVDRVMREQMSTPQERARVILTVSEQAGIRLPPNFIKQSFDQLTLYHA